MTYEKLYKQTIFGKKCFYCGHQERSHKWIDLPKPEPVGGLQAVREMGSSFSTYVSRYQSCHCGCSNFESVTSWYARHRNFMCSFELVIK